MNRFTITIEGGGRKTSYFVRVADSGRLVADRSVRDGDGLGAGLLSGTTALLTDVRIHVAGEIQRMDLAPEDQIKPLGWPLLVRKEA